MSSSALRSTTMSLAAYKSFWDCDLNAPNLLAQYLDERTRGIPGRRAELQCDHFRLMPGDRAIETNQ
jgi:hypothetical protein